MSVTVCDDVCMRPRAECQRTTGNVRGLFHSNRYTMKGTEWRSPSDGIGCLRSQHPGLVGPHSGEAVEPRLELLDAGQCILHHIHGRQRAGSDERRRLHGGTMGKLEISSHITDRTACDDSAESPILVATIRVQGCARDVVGE